MGRILPPLSIIINDFSLGVTNNLRSDDIRFAKNILHFDIFSAKNKLIPFSQLEADGSVGNTEKLTMFLSAGTTQANTKQYALGVVSGQLYAKIFERASLPTGAWTGSTTGESSGIARNERLFVLYRDSGGNQVIYGAKGGTTIWSYRIDNNTFTEDGSTAPSNALTYTDIGQGIVHSKDDILYVPYDNKIAKNNAGTWTDVALTLPTGAVITSICEYGNFLAIATKPKFLGGSSYVYLWDRNEVDTTLSQKIEWGAEDLYLIQELEGALIGISTTAATSILLEPKIFFKQYTGTGAKQFLELPIDAPPANGVTIGHITQKQNGRIYFMMSFEVDDVQFNGVWSIGKSSSGTWALSMDRKINNDTDITGTPKPLGFQLLGDYMTVAYNDGNDYKANRTDDASPPGFTNATSVYETIILNFGDASVTKKLLSVTIISEPLPTAGQVVVKYKKDEETTFANTILTNTTDNSIRKSAINIESSGATLPQFKEIIFRLESTGNCIITGLKIRVEEVKDDLID